MLPLTRKSRSGSEESSVGLQKGQQQEPAAMGRQCQQRRRRSSVTSAAARCSLPSAHPTDLRLSRCDLKADDRWRLLVGFAFRYRRTLPWAAIYTHRMSTHRGSTSRNKETHQSHVSSKEQQTSGVGNRRWQMQTSSISATCTPATSAWCAESARWMAHLLRFAGLSRGLAHWNLLLFLLICVCG